VNVIHLDNVSIMHMETLQRKWLSSTFYVVGLYLMDIGNVRYVHWDMVINLGNIVILYSCWESVFSLSHSNITCKIV